MAKKILIMGLPGSGKTTLASKLVPIMKAKWLNADKIRSEANDWDFSNEGRIRQSKRMRNLSDFESKNNRVSICDFICPTEETRQIFKPDFLIWMNSVSSSNFHDTDSIFQEPKIYDYKIDSKNEYSLRDIILKINEKI